MLKQQLRQHWMLMELKKQSRCSLRTSAIDVPQQMILHRPQLIVHGICYMIIQHCSGHGQVCCWRAKISCCLMLSFRLILMPWLVSWIFFSTKACDTPRDRLQWLLQRHTIMEWLVHGASELGFLIFSKRESFHSIPIDIPSRQFLRMKMLCRKSRRSCLKNWRQKPFISLLTAQRWLAKLKWRYKKVKNGMYIDGHEQNDVVAYWSAFVHRWAENKTWFPFLDDNPHPHPSNLRTLVLITYNKSTFFQNDKRTTCWSH